MGGGDKPQCQPLSWDRQKHRVLVFLCLTLAITPVRWLTGWHWLVKFRRMMGLFSFFYGTVHTAAYIVFDRVAGLDAPIRTQPAAATAHIMSAIGADLLRPFSRLA